MTFVRSSVSALVLRKFMCRCCWSFNLWPGGIEEGWVPSSVLEYCIMGCEVDVNCDIRRTGQTEGKCNGTVVHRIGVDAGRKKTSWSVGFCA